MLRSLTRERVSINTVAYGAKHENHRMHGHVQGTVSQTNGVRPKPPGMTYVLESTVEPRNWQKYGNPNHVEIAQNLRD